MSIAARLCVTGPRCSASLATALAPGDRCYQDNMVLLTEIGFFWLMGGSCEGGREGASRRVSSASACITTLLCFTWTDTDVHSGILTFPPVHTRNNGSEARGGIFVLTQ